MLLDPGIIIFSENNIQPPSAVMQLKEIQTTPCSPPFPLMGRDDPGKNASSYLKGTVLEQVSDSLLREVFSYERTGHARAGLIANDWLIHQTQICNVILAPSPEPMEEAEAEARRAELERAWLGEAEGVLGSLGLTRRRWAVALGVEPSEVEGWFAKQAIPSEVKERLGRVRDVLREVGVPGGRLNRAFVTEPMLRALWVEPWDQARVLVWVKKAAQQTASAQERLERLRGSASEGEQARNWAFNASYLVEPEP